jgi:hypothetical protein
MLCNVDTQAEKPAEEEAGEEVEGQRPAGWLEWRRSWNGILK